MLSQSTGVAANLFQQDFDLVDQRRQEERDALRAHADAQQATVVKIATFRRTATEAQIKQMTRDLYWFAPDLGIGVAEALGYSDVNQMRDAAGVFRTGEDCGRCQQEIVRTANYGSYRYEAPGFEDPVCQSCHDDLRSRRPR